MRKLEKEIDRLEEAAERKRRREFDEICARYGNKAEEFIKHGSAYEKDFVFQFLWPQGVEDFMDLFEVFGPTVFAVAFEKLIYPAVLGGEAKEDVVLAIDHAFLQLVYPDLWKEFMTELKALKPKSAISDALKTKFNVAKTELEELKNKVREKMRSVEEEDKKRLQQEA